MKRSIDRILTTHVGSLPRPADLLDLVRAKEDGKPIDEKAHTARLTFGPDRSDGRGWSRDSRSPRFADPLRAA